MPHAPDREANIAQSLEALALRQPAAPALHVQRRKSLSFADLAEQIRYVSERLGRWNIGRGDVVAGVVPLRPEMALACATIPAAATFAPLSPALTTDAYRELLQRLRPKALLVPKGLAHPARHAALRCGLAVLELIPDAGAPAGRFTLELSGEQRALAQERSTDPEWAYILSTSGTTGRPKLVPISHGRVTLNAQRQGDWLRFTANDVGAHLIPMHHSLGLSSALLIPLLRGASVVCLPESDVDGFFSALDGYSVTWFPAAFTHCRGVLRRAGDYRAAVARNRLRCMRVGAGRLEPEEVDAIEQTFRAPLLTAFSMTEAFTITHEALPPRMRKRGSVGIPVANQVAVMSEAGAVCGAGEVGEIVVRGPLVFAGYFDDAQATAASFADGWFHTGDLGYFDEDRHFYLQGRIKDIINRGGEKISPMTADAVVASHPAVLAAVTFGIPHPTLGEELAAAVVKDGRSQIDAADIVEWAKERMAAGMAPRRIYFVNELPRTDLGKVRRSELPRLLGLDLPGQSMADKSIAEPPVRATSALESALVGLWCSVLQVSTVDVRDDFFLLGGDSLRGARLLVHVKAVFGVDLTIETLFGKAATVAGMAHEIEAVRLANTSVHHG